MTEQVTAESSPSTSATGTSIVEDTKPNSFASHAIPSLRDELVKAADEATAAQAKEATDTPAKEVSEPTEEVASDEANASQAGIVAAPKADNLSEVRRALNKRKQEGIARRERDEAIRQSTASLEAERHRFAQHQAQIDSQRQALEAREREIMSAMSDPLKLAQLMSKTPDELAQRLAIAGSPEDMLQRKLEAQVESLRLKQEAQDRAWAEREQQLERVAQENKYREQVTEERKFVELATDDSKYPTFAKLALTSKQKLKLGYDVAEEYYEATKKVASHEEILEYLEHSLSGGAAGQRDGSSQSRGTNGNVPKSKTGPRTLSNSVASERRSSPKPINNDLQGEDLRKELMAAAEEAKAQRV